MSSIVQLLGAGTIGGVLTQYISRAAERRGARARVVQTLSAVELSRWAGSEPEDGKDFNHAATELVSAAMVAGMPRALVSEYLTLARAALWESQKSWNEYPDPETGGGIPLEFADVVQLSARHLASALWHPYWARLFQQRRLAEVRRAIAGSDRVPIGAIERSRSFSQW